MSFQPWPVKNSAIRVYVIGRNNLLELFHNELVSSQVRFADGPMSRRAYEQLMNLETEIGENGIVYRCPSGRHDDLGISCAMLAWAARHPHLLDWFGIFERSRTIRKPRRDQFGWAAFT